MFFRKNRKARPDPLTSLTSTVNRRTASEESNHAISHWASCRDEKVRGEKNVLLADGVRRVIGAARFLSISAD
jgi:hypothetical protein